VAGGICIFTMYFFTMSCICKPMNCKLGVFGSCELLHN
jgi:hypothetical protein